MITHLVVSIAPKLTAELDIVLAANPTDVVDELHRGIVVFVGTFGAIAEARVGIDRDAGDAPLHGRAAGQAGNAQAADDVVVKGQLRPGGVVEGGASKTELVDQAIGEHAGVGEHPLGGLGDDGFAVEEETLVDLILFAATVAAKPIGLGRLDKVEPLNKLILIHRTAQGLGVVVG